MKRFAIIVIYFVAFFTLKAQVPDALTATYTSGLKDTLEKPKVEYFDLSAEGEIVRMPWDTLLIGFHRYDPAWRALKSPLKLGNIISPVISGDVRERKPLSDVPFMDPYQPYIATAEELYFFKVREPFTQLSYASGGQKENLEQRLDVVHTQNVNEKLNVGLRLNFLSGEGQYSYQKEGKKSFGFFTGYTGKRYHLFASYHTNRISREENGGISDKDLIGVSRPKDLPTFLGQENEASTDIKNSRITLIQSYNIGKFRDTTLSQDATGKDFPEASWGKIMYRTTFEKDKHTYSDNLPDGGFYRNIYIDSLQTFDSAYYRSWNHDLSIHLQSNPEKKFAFSSVFGATYEMQKYLQNQVPDSQFTATDTTISLFRNYLTNNIAVYGELINDIGSGFHWKVNGKVYLEGYKAGNTYLHGEMVKHFGRGEHPATWYIYGSLGVSRPAYWLNHFSSNHFIWDNDFRFKKKVSVGTRFTLPAASFQLSGEASLYDQYIYFDSLALPVQAGEAFLTYSGTLDKTFSFWKIRSHNSLTLQLSANNEVMPLPNILFRNSTYFHHIFHFASTGGMLETQLGFDLYYFTPFDGYAFMPATGLFYVQHDQQTGNYPVVDVFLNVKVKRTRIFLKVDHVNADLTGNHYFLITDYPINPLFVKFGLSWTFYD